METSAQGRETTTKGFFFAAAAFGAWGLLPLYWKLLSAVPALEILGHRILWSAISIALLLTLKKRWREIPQIWRQGSSYLLLLSTFIIAGNWLLYIWAVNTGHVLETSLGYFVTPLLNVVLGIVVLGEKLRRPQWIAVGLASVGVLYMTLDYGQFPWISLGLAVSFGFYGLVRKMAPAGPLLGLGIETFALGLPTFFYLVYLESRSVGHLIQGEWTVTATLVAAGPVTFLPLLWFNEGAKRLPLSTLGLMQYLSPTLQLVQAVFVFGEKFTAAHLVTFIFIWSALALYSHDAWRTERSLRRATRRPV